ncbi:hypothetical protein MPL1_03028 [Methylophaga lonarensis MPL]|uniref:Transmembrane protein n=1 Tax=Methylophaga lonarensis MPL TaxID=1286106 RepID=M7PTT9_9GAMM|nr:DUF4282 domain-containing protein [Methylophaga lonarensis]EMR13869.1 hypothetical protein MPL1_03028 [Methylophaga lonarensis MPL]
MKDIFYFDSMLTPKIITLVYWLILFFVVISGLGLMFSGNGFFGFLSGIAAIIAGGVFARIWCELLIVLFKIHENIKKVAEK